MEGMVVFLNKLVCEYHIVESEYHRSTNNEYIKYNLYRCAVSVCLAGSGVWLLAL